MYKNIGIANETATLRSFVMWSLFMYLFCLINNRLIINYSHELRNKDNHDYPESK